MKIDLTNVSAYVKSSKKEYLIDGYKINNTNDKINIYTIDREIIICDKNDVEIHLIDTI